MASLVGKSLLRADGGAEDEEAGGPRFAMLETVREFGLERLAESGEGDEIRRRHAAWALDLAEEGWHAFRLGSRMRAGMERLALEHDNLRAALARLEATAPGEGLRLAGALWPFWYRRGLPAEGRGWLERALASGAAVPAAVRARALTGAGQLAEIQGDLERAAALAEESLALCRAGGDAWGVAANLDLLAMVAEFGGRDDEAMAKYGDVLVLFRELDDPHRTLNALVNLADTAYRLGDLARSEALAEESLALETGTGDDFIGAMALGNVAQLALARGDAARARALWEEVGDRCARIGVSLGVADALGGLAAVAGAAGRPERAARWLGAAQAGFEATGVPVAPHHGQFRRAAAAARTALGEAAFAVAWDTGRALRLDEAVAEARNAAEEPVGPPPVPAAHSSGLTPRELDVLRLLVAGRTDREIAEALFISHRTAQGHVASIFAKLGVNNRTAAAIAAVAAGLATADPPSPA